jgi:hypothetical protein
MGDACPICGLRPASVMPIVGSAGPSRVSISCARCGDFTLLDQAYDLPAEWKAGRHPDRKPRGRFAASHAIRRMQAGGTRRPEIDEAQLRLLWAQPLPNPQRQLDLLLLLLGDAGLPIDQYLHGRVEYFCAEIGTEDDPTQGRTGGYNLIVRRLGDRGLIETDPHPPAPTVGHRLSIIDGWAEYGRLRREVVESKTAFMAMGYSNPTLATIVAEHFVPAVRETGFELYRLDDRPKPGLIDNRMRVEIRAARFLVCDLTDENRGAYWESGFAEGAGKPVFYTCEKSKFSATRTHFDTEHLQTVRWDSADPASAAEELKTVIRNAFPADSIPPDLSKRSRGSGA